MGAEAHDVFIEAEDLEVFEVHLIDCVEFLGELVGGAIDMGVVHVEGSDAHEAEEFA
ncbi:MAG: hypothetical protein RI897_3937 [Verrucomicrobiota bacterium]